MYWHVYMKMAHWYDIIHLYIYVISIGYKYLPAHSNNNTGKVTTPVDGKKYPGKVFKLKGTRKISHLYITISLLVIFYYQSFTINITCKVLTTSNLFTNSSNLMNSSNLKRETSNKRYICFCFPNIPSNMQHGLMIHNDRLKQW